MPWTARQRCHRVGGFRKGPAQQCRASSTVCHDSTSLRRIESQLVKPCAVLVAPLPCPPCLRRPRLGAVRRDMICFVMVYHVIVWCTFISCYVILYNMLHYTCYTITCCIMTWHIILHIQYTIILYNNTADYIYIYIYIYTSILQHATDKHHKMSWAARRRHRIYIHIYIYIFIMRLRSIWRYYIYIYIL